MSDIFSLKNVLKQGGALSPLVFKFALKYAIRLVDMKLCCKHQLLDYAGDVNMLGGKVHTIKKNTVALVVALKEMGLEVNSVKPSTLACLEIRTQDAVTL
jgi:hypothetical protein